MRAPLQYWFDRSFAAAEARKIDAEYQLSLVAESSCEIVEVQRRMFESQALVADRIAEDRLRPIHDWMRDEGEGSEEMLAWNGRESPITSLGLEVRKQRPQLRQSLAAIADDLSLAAHSLWRMEEMLRQPVRTPIDVATREAHELLREGSCQLDSELRSQLFAKAQRGLEKAFAESPSPHGCFLLGWVLWRHGEDFRAAERCFHRGGTMAQANDRGLATLAFRHQANMLYKLGRYADAREAAEAACLANPHDADAWYELARYACRTGEESGCRKALVQAIALRPIFQLTLLSEPDFFASSPL